MVDGFKQDEHNVSDQCYHDQILRATGLIMSMLVQALTDPDAPFTPWQAGEAWLERIFGQMRTGAGNDRTFSMAQLPNIFAQVSAGGHGAKWLYAFNDPLRKLTHGNDGIIFTPVVDPYIPGARIPLLLRCMSRHAHSTEF